MEKTAEMQKAEENAIGVWRFYLPLPVLLAGFLVWKRTSLDVLTLVRYSLLLGFGYCAAIYDLRKRIVPNLLLLGMLAAWVMWAGAAALTDWDTALLYILRALAGGAILGLSALLVYFLSRRGLGGGDVKFLAVSGLYLTVGPGLMAIFLGTVLSALTALVLMLLRKIGTKDAIPLVPFLYIGILAVSVLA